MTILSISAGSIGEVGVNPRRVPVITTDDLATITTAGYLDDEIELGTELLSTDIFDITYSFDEVSGVGTYGVFTIAFSNGISTLTAYGIPGDVVLPVVNNNFAMFEGTTGTIGDDGYFPSDATKTTVMMANGATVVNHIMVSTDTAGTSGNLTGTAINDGNIEAGRSGLAGAVVSFPGTVTSGSLAVTSINNAGDYANIISNASTGQATTWTLPDPGAATANVILNKSIGGQTVTTAISDPTPGTIRAFKGLLTQATTTMTSGNIVGVRGEVDLVGASGGFVYGVQGKVVPTGTISGSVWVPAVFGQFDLSAATITDGQLACLWGDMGATATAGTYTGLRGIAMTNTTAAICNSQVYLYGGATSLLELVDNNGLVGATYFVTAGTTAGSAGDTTKCNASKALHITVNGTSYWLPLFASNS